MGKLAERMIVKEVQEKSRMNQEGVVLRNKITQENKQRVNILTLRLFSYKGINNEWFWKFIAYTYFICKTLGLLILVDVFIFNRPNLILFTFIFFCFYYFNRKLYKLYPRRKN